jgi:hypothetical protein
MCALCRIQADQTVLCPSCFERLVADRALPGGVGTYRDYGRLAAGLVIVGLIPFLGLVAGPAAIYFATRRLRQLRTLDQDGRVGVFLAMGLGVLESLANVAWVAFLLMPDRTS